MHHDFRKYDAKTKSFTSRTDDAGNTCTNVLGVMDYSDKQAQHWTACSKKDFNAFYKHQMSRFGSFCLEQWLFKSGFNVYLLHCKMFEPKINLWIYLNITVYVSNGNNLLSTVHKCIPGTIITAIVGLCKLHGQG